ncbi:MAG: methionine--tRNA ligase subunit beta [Promethearchaeota archaeon]
MAQKNENKISYEEFRKLDIRVGQIVEVEQIPKSRNLIKLKVDIGEKEPRQILAGISKYYTPEELLNRKIIVLANLKPRKLMGMESNGMLLAADVEDKPYLLKLPEEIEKEVPPGSKII